MRRWLGTLLGLVAIAATALTVWTYLSDRNGELVLVLTEVDGQVKLTTPSGEVEAAKVGRELSAQDRIETSASSTAVLGVGYETRIRLGPATSIEVQGVDEAGIQLELDDGALTAVVRPEAIGVRIGSEGREVLATNADFRVGAFGDVLQVESTRGSVSLSGLEATRVEEGQLATIVDRRVDVDSIPESLLLEVAWPDAARTREPTTLLSGVTSPGARVTAVGTFGRVETRADGQGRFEVSLPLGEGDNEVRLSAVDLRGVQTEVEGMLQTRDTRGPSVRGGVRYGN